MKETHMVLKHVGVYIGLVHSIESTWVSFIGLFNRSLS